MSIQDTDGNGRSGEGTIDEGERKENEMASLSSDCGFTIGKSNLRIFICGETHDIFYLTYIFR